MEEVTNVENTQEEITAAVNGKVCLPSRVSPETLTQFLVSLDESVWGVKTLKTAVDSLINTLNLAEKKLGVVEKKINFVNRERTDRQKSGDKRKSLTRNATSFFKNMSDESVKAYAKAMKINTALYETADEIREALVTDYLLRHS